MSAYFKTEGIILKKKDRGEHDRVFTVFTREFGKLHLWAVSERKITSKLRSSLEIAYHSDLAFVQGKNKKTIIDAYLVKPYAMVHTDLPKLKVSLRIVETLDVFLKGEIQDLKVWNLLIESLDALDSNETTIENCSRVYYYFFWNVVSDLGWKPLYDALENKASYLVRAFLEHPLSFTLSFKKEEFYVECLRTITQRYFSKMLQEVQ